jgi:hypothetical protein
MNSQFQNLLWRSWVYKSLLGSDAPSLPVPSGWFLCVSATEGRWSLLSCVIRMVPVHISHCRALTPFFPMPSGWFLCVSATAGLWRLSFRCHQDGSCAYRHWRALMHFYAVASWWFMCVAVTAGLWWAPFPWLEDVTCAYQPLQESGELLHAVSVRRI